MVPMALHEGMFSHSDANPTTSKNNFLCDENDKETIYRMKECSKFEDHSAVFTLFKDFKMEDLPANLRFRSISLAVRLFGLLTVQIEGTKRSESRPEVSLIRKRNFEFPQRKPFGSGIIEEITFQTAGISEPCDIKVRIKTAKHVLFDESEIKNATAKFHDGNGDPKVLFGIREIKSNVEHDVTVAEFETDDRALWSTLSEVLSMKAILAQDLRSSSLINDINAAIVISHPHGGFKCVSVGTIHRKHRLDRPYCLYGHDAPTCGGCSGAPVWLLGIPTSEDFCLGIHSHNYEELNWSGALVHV